MVTLLSPVDSSTSGSPRAGPAPRGAAEQQLGRGGAARRRHEEAVRLQGRRRGHGEGAAVLERIL